MSDDRFKHSGRRSEAAVGNRARLLDGRFRLAFVLFGGMVALQSSPTLDATKIAYLIGTTLCLIGASAAVWSARGSDEFRRAVPWIAASVALALVIAMSFFIARSYGTSVTDWVRDIAAYGLFAAVPILALDGEASASRKLLVGMLVLAGLLGGVSWAVEWLGRRHILDLPFHRFVFPSSQLPGALYLFAMATAFSASLRRGRWIVLAGVLLGLFLLTGTRSSLLLLIGPLAMAALAGWARIGLSVRTIVLQAIVAAAVVVAFQITLALPSALGLGRPPEEPSSSSAPATSVPDVLGNRFGSLPGVLGNPALDPSFKERVAQYRAAWALFKSSPILGVGPGHPIRWTDVSGYPRAGFTADTPLVMPAKFGLLGILVFLGAAAAYGSTMLSAVRGGRRSVMAMTLVGYGAWTVVGLPLGFPIEDKGASLALLLLLALTWTDGRAANDSFTGEGTPASAVVGRLPSGDGGQAGAASAPPPADE
jgi:hypothetical protein